MFGVSIVHSFGNFSAYFMRLVPHLHVVYFIYGRLVPSAKPGNNELQRDIKAIWTFLLNEWNGKEAYALGLIKGFCAIQYQI